MAPRRALKPLPPEFDDAGFAHRLVLGAAIGIPVIFLITLLVALQGAGLASALMVALWAAIVGGPFAGGFAAVVTGSSDSGSGDVDELPRRTAEKVPSRRHAA